MPKIVALLGDSTLDNSYWVNPDETVFAQLQAKMPADTIIDLAVDGFTTNNVLRGGYQDKVVHSSRHVHQYYKPLEELAKNTNVSHVVLSVGGNDIREKLQALFFQDAKERKATLEAMTKEIQNNYLEILQRIKAINPAIQPVIMLQYTPDSTHDTYGIYRLMAGLRTEETPSYFSLLWFLIFGRQNQAQLSAVEQLHKIMQTVYKPILQYAKENNIPVVDMASSLDHRDTQYYNTQIEPSAKGSEVIANLISYVMDNHEFQSDSLIYSQPNNNFSRPFLSKNHDSWKPRRNQPSTKEEARQLLISEHDKQFTSDKQAWFGLYSFFAANEVKPEMTFDELLEHGQHSNNRCHAVMQKLEWLDENNELTFSPT